MLAALGFATQAYVTGKGPLENAVDHLRDPFGQNSAPFTGDPCIVSHTLTITRSQPRQTAHHASHAVANGSRCQMMLICSIASAFARGNLQFETASM